MKVAIIHVPEVLYSTLRELDLSPEEAEAYTGPVYDNATFEAGAGAVCVTKADGDIVVHPYHTIKRVEVTQ